MTKMQTKPDIIIDKTSDTSDNEENQDDTNTVMVDILPSYQLYDQLHGHIPSRRSSDTHLYSLPSYCESTASSLFSGNAHHYNNNIANSNTNTTTRTTTVNGENTRSAIMEEMELNIGKIYSLPQISAPVDIKIYITKLPQKSNVDNANCDSTPCSTLEQESLFKIYTSNEIVSGYVIVENKSNTPLNFEMFYLTLEGYASVLDRGNAKRSIKRFLRMVDMSASWSETNIILASGYKYKCHALESDGSILGLNNNRCLEPGVKYKKYFIFKFPEKLLHDCCKHEINSHLQLPSSFGLDHYIWNSKKYAGLEINPMFGVGHLGYKGSPLLTMDLAPSSTSIHYSVDARLVGLNTITTANNGNDQLCLYKIVNYQLRYIPSSPDVNNTCDCGSTDFEYKVSSLNNGFHKLDILFNMINNSKEFTMDDIIYDDNEHGTHFNGVNASNNNNNNNNNKAKKGSTKLSQLYKETSSHNKKSFRKSSLLENSLAYSLNHMSTLISNKFVSNLLFPSSYIQKNKNVIFSGIIIISSEHPEKNFILPAQLPSILRNARSEFDKNKLGKVFQNTSKTPFNIIKTLKINLKCLESNNCDEHQPPKIKSIKLKLVCVNYSSMKIIPISLSALLLLSNEITGAGFEKRCEKILNRIKECNDKFNSNMGKIQSLYKPSSNDQQTISFNDFIPKNLKRDLQNISEGKIDVKVLDNFFQIDNYNTIVRKPWTKQQSRTYNNELEIQFSIKQNLKYNIVPDFQSCLCARFYCIRVEVEFYCTDDNNKSYINIPISFKNI
ncbi:uncharacterized protein SCODWIG_00699 [Saccharomycodes ludwigii]|uniref:Bul1 N-terminal domain-containing protein n=1 Tax=Saccharomycodes ludwigii TaxID=36035 RepID=A0A376B2N2_9ASCO|nr:uncharacterized protein SCODWIG_00699 [Saccharomycodes ludwigii]